MMVRKFGITAFLVVAACAGSKGSSTKFADGLIFEIALFEEGHKKIGRDRIMIDSGLESIEGRAKGFMKGPIEVNGVKGNFSFVANTKTALGFEEITWTGKVEGDRIDGFYIWNQRDKAPVKITFEGRLVPSAPSIVIPPPSPAMKSVPTPSTLKPQPR